MKASHSDAQRLYRHFGFAPAEYRELSTRPVASGASAAPGPAAAAGPYVLEDLDLNDYRHFALRR